MPGWPIHIVGGIAGLYYMNQMWIYDNDNSNLYDNRYSYRRQGSRVERDEGFSWGNGMWPARSGWYQDPAAMVQLRRGNCGDDQGGGSPGSYEQSSAGGDGCQSTKSIRGVCLDSGSAPVPGCEVQGFRTADDLYIGSTFANAIGVYELACPNTPSDQHYLVAYDASGNRAGTTINTLVPSWRDGT